MRAHDGSDRRVRAEQHSITPSWESFRIVFDTSRFQFKGRCEVTDRHGPITQHAVLLVGPYELIRFSQALPVAVTNAVFYTTVPDVVRVEAPIQIAREHGDVGPQYFSLLEDLFQGVHALVELALVGGPAFFFVLSLCVLCISLTPSRLRRTLYVHLHAIGA